MITAPQIADATTDATEPSPAPPSPITPDDRAAVCADYFGPDANLLVDVRRWRETGEVGDADELQRLERLALGYAVRRGPTVMTQPIVESLDRLLVATGAPGSALAVLAAKWRDDADQFIGTYGDCMRRSAGELEAALRQQASAPGQAFQVTPEEWAKLGWAARTTVDSEFATRRLNEILAARPSAPSAQAQSFEEAFAATGYQYGEDALEQVRLGWELALKAAPVASAQAWTLDQATDLFSYMLDAGSVDVERTSPETLLTALQDTFPVAPVASAPVAGGVTPTASEVEARSHVRPDRLGASDWVVRKLSEFFDRATGLTPNDSGRVVMTEADEWALHDSWKLKCRDAESEVTRLKRELESAQIESADWQRRAEHAKSAERDLAASRAAHEATFALLKQRSDCLEATTVRKATAEQAAADWQGRAEAAEKRASEAEASRNLAADREQDSEKRAAELERERVELGNVWEERDTISAELAKAREELANVRSILASDESVARKEGWDGGKEALPTFFERMLGHRGLAISDCEYVAKQRDAVQVELAKAREELRDERAMRIGADGDVKMLSEQCAAYKKDNVDAAMSTVKGLAQKLHAEFEAKFDPIMTKEWRDRAQAAEAELAACKAKLEGLRDACDWGKARVGMQDMQSAIRRCEDAGVLDAAAFLGKLQSALTALAATKPAEGPKAGESASDYLGRLPQSETPTPPLWSEVEPGAVLSGEAAKAFMLANPGRRVRHANMKHWIYEARDGSIRMTTAGGSTAFDDDTHMAWSYVVLPPEPASAEKPSLEERVVRVEKAMRLWLDWWLNHDDQEDSVYRAMSRALDGAGKCGG